ncbi:MAG: response regulator receiver protein [Salaquimonas sp.]
MASPKESKNMKSVYLVSSDTNLINMAKGAIASSEEQSFKVIEKKIGDLAGEVREFTCDLLILDVNASRVEDFEQLQKIKRMVGTNMAIIVIADNFTPAAARILIQLKITDFLVKPLQTSEFVRSINNCLKTAGDETQIEPQFLSFMPASGGVGNTILALESAAILNRHGKKLGRSTCVVDLNFQLGSCAEYLDIEPRFHISEIENAPERLDRQLLDVMLSKHESGLSLIAAPNQPTEMRSFKHALVVRLLDLVSAYFDYVVIDVPRIWFPWTETVLMGSNRIFVVADMTVPSVRHSKRILDAITEKGGQQIDPKVIVNRMDFRKNVAGLNASDVEAALGDKMIGQVPNNYTLVRDAVDRGVQFCEIEADNNVTRALQKIILNETVEAKNIETKSSGLMALGRKLLAKKAA